MTWGTIPLFCPWCGKEFTLAHLAGFLHKHFGYACSKSCYDNLDHAYARRILGKDTSKFKILGNTILFALEPSMKKNEILYVSRDKFVTVTNVGEDKEK